MAKTKQHHWNFAVTFRKNTYRWDGTAKAKANIVAAISEIRATVRKSHVLAAEGATILLERLVPSIQRVDSSSGAMGSAVRSAIPHLAALIGGGASDLKHYDRLERVFQALQDDDMGYLDLLGDEFAVACASAENASVWADRLEETTDKAFTQDIPFAGASVCLSCLFAAGRYDELIALLRKRSTPSWTYDHWGAKALAAQGKADEAIALACGGKDLAQVGPSIASFCESVLLESGRQDEAYRTYGLRYRANNHLQTFRDLCKRYPNLDPRQILLDLIESAPGEEGKWFAAARRLGDLPLAVRLAQAGPCSPSTILRAVDDLREEHHETAFALVCAALRGFALGWAYELDPAEVRRALAVANSLATTPQRRQTLDLLLSTFPTFFD